MPTKFDTKDDVVAEPVHTAIRIAKFRVPEDIPHTLDILYPKALEAARKMLVDRSLSSSKYWKEIPCVVEFAKHA